MSGFLPLRPGLWWMRRWHLPGKLVTLGVLMAVVLVATATAAAPRRGGAGPWALWPCCMGCWRCT